MDRKRIAVGGESAGGGHAAALAIASRDRKEIPIIFQLLIYPMLDDRTGSTRAVSPHIGKFIWTADSNVFGWTSLLGVPAGSPNVPVGAINEEAGIVTHHLEAALWPGDIGKDIDRHFTISGDQLTITFNTITREGLKVARTLIWERMK